MLRNYLKIAFRNLSRHKLFSFINIFGLALSMSVCMMVMLRLKEQFSYDKFHPKSERVYRILSEVSNAKGGKFHMASTPLPLLQSVISENNVVDDAVHVYPAINEKAESAGKQIAVRGAFTGPSFFNVFGFSLAAGNKQTALQLPNSIVLSKETAEKFFGTGNAIGKMLDFEKLGSFLVTGVMSEQGKSHLEYDAYVSISAVPQLEKAGKLASKLNNWDSFEQGYTYVLLNRNASPVQLNSTLSRVAGLINRETKDGSFAFTTQPLNSITPSKLNLSNDIGGGSDWSKIWTEIGIALLILVAACFNYTNLTIARALTRAKEVGIRKVSGAVRSQVFAQYVIESIVIALFALALASIFLQLILQYKPFNDGYEMVPDVGLDISTLLWFVAFAVVTGAIAGAAPAWILSAFKPVMVLKNISTHKLFGNVSLQKSLIVFQFTLSLVVIIFLSTFYRQFSFMGDMDPGFKKDNILTISLNGGDPALFTNEAARIPGVESITALSANFGSNSASRTYAALDKSVTQPVQLSYYFADAALIPTMGIKLLAGSNLPQTPSDEERYILINERAVQAFAFKNNSDALGKMIWVNDSTQLQVAGVINDFYYAGANRYIAPMAIRSKAGAFNHLNISVAAADRGKIVDRLSDAWKKTYPGKAFTYAWLGRHLKEMNAQTATVSLLGFLAFMTVAIASLGLLGLVIYTVETKRKEISIRKVIGAGVQQLMMLLSKGFIKLLLIAGLIAMPLGYVMSFFFLQGFASRVSLGFVSVLMCFLFLLAIGLLTILSQTYRASARNPVDSLKAE